MKTIDRAIAYLNVKPRTKAQVIRYLEGKGCKQTEIDEAVAELEEYRYIDDLGYAKSYFEIGFEKGRGERRIRYELRGKGIEDSLIDKAFDSLDSVPDPYEQAYEIAASSISEQDGYMSYEEREKARGRIARRLAARGFTQDVAYRVAKELIK